MGNNRPTLYVGMTNDLVRRVSQHKAGSVEGFTSKYKLNKLLYFEILEKPSDAIMREKRLKKWNRAWKLELIKQKNPTLRDLYKDLLF